MQLRKFEQGESIRDPAFREKLNDLVDAVNVAQDDSEWEDTSLNTRAIKGIPVELTARTTQGGGEFQFKEKVWNDSTGQWDDKTGGLTHTELGACRAKGSPPSVAAAAAHIGDVVYIQPKCARDGNNAIYEFDVSPKLFPVNVTVNSGINGVSGASAPTWTYDIKDKDGNTLETNLTPENPRQTEEYVKGTTGLAYIDTNGAWKLATVFEEVIPPTAGGANNDGYITIRDDQGPNTVTELNNGIIEFIEATPSAGQLPVTFTVSDPGGLVGNVEGVVDVSGITGNSGVLAGASFFDKEVWVEDTAATGIYDLGSTANYSGRLIQVYGHGVESNDVADWNEVNNSGSYQTYYIGSNYTADVVLLPYAGGKARIFLDQSDSFKLKLEVITAPAAGFTYYARIMLVCGPRKTAADQTIS